MSDPPLPSRSIKLELLPRNTYVGVNDVDPIKLYYWPIFGKLYRRRMELALGECKGGDRVLDVGFGTGVAFLNLSRMYREIHGLDLTADAAKVQAMLERQGVRTQLLNGNILQMPYPDDHFDTVISISILEHLKPDELRPAFEEIRRILKPGGQLVYGVPIERPLMVFMFRMLQYDIRQHHFSTEIQVRDAASAVLQRFRSLRMRGTPAFLGDVYEVGHFTKPLSGSPS